MPEGPRFFPAATAADGMTMAAAGSGESRLVKC